MPLHERVQPCPQNDVLPHALRRTTFDEILDKASPGHHAQAGIDSSMRIHIGTFTPILFGRRQLQANEVGQHMRRWIEFHVQSPPQGGT
ncbi:Uncharacterised protein [Mycobacteroides abscessus subsp. abscessus]|nr:Uncharacterised protein [Mycobacteroides abscessus subsp. abscessus]SHX73720.1 Uncharacterised protein [Mycobacteroides abscessus subsp. abscessus]SKH62353.1 Uncharacterised protein [Mycobacteroides abscessus subsp. abscessus]SKH70852.1 Uncharacterised protein [Mycobacteroides abscessus subsp. abscessus]SKH71036.1 Uncharacterised protein [Mycobacteroides abscessus subsp. abscessus]